MEKENKWMKGAAAAAAIGAAIGAVKVVRDAKREADEKLFEDLVKISRRWTGFPLPGPENGLSRPCRGKKGTCILPALQTRQPGCSDPGGRAAGSGALSSAGGPEQEDGETGRAAAC